MHGLVQLGAAPLRRTDRLRDLGVERGEGLAVAVGDADNDLVADVPKDPSRQKDPSALIFAYSPTENPAVYQHVYQPLMDHLGVERADVMGHSTGGAIGQTLSIMLGSRRVTTFVGASTSGAPRAPVGFGSVEGIARAKGERIPDGWIVDKDGRPTTDARAALEGSMLPIGAVSSPKGAMLALVVELLVTALIGAQFGFEASSFFVDEGNRPRIGQAFVVVDPGALAGVLGQPCADSGVDRLLVGDQQPLACFHRRESRAAHYP